MRFLAARICWPKAADSVVLEEPFSRGVLEQAPDWKDLRAVVRVRATRTRGDQSSVEDCSYLTSLQGEASERTSVLMGAALSKTALHVSRLHWGVENGLHWLLDVVFRDDASKIKPVSLGRISKCQWNPSDVGKSEHC